MTRNLKALGLALVAVFAMSAMAASAAYATEQGHVVGENTGGNHVDTIVRGEDKSGQSLVFNAEVEGAPKVSCANNQFDSTITGGTTKSLTLEPTFFTPCAAGAFPATVHANECHYRFDTFQTDTPLGGDTWKVTADVVCPQGTPGIQVTVHAGAPHSPGNRICTITVPPQTGIQGVTIHNITTDVGHDDLTVTVAAKSITRTQQGLCGHQHGTAEFNGGVTLTATDEDDNPINLYIDHTQP